MANELTVIDGFQVPDYLKGKAPMQSDFGRAGGLPKISVMKDGFKITVDGQEQRLPAPLPVVILGVTPAGDYMSRSYYIGAYNPGEVSAPDCSSKDGITPDAGDYRQSDRCATCPQAAWGSDGKGQACKQGKTLFVTPANKPDGTVFQLRVSPTSLKPLAAYGAKLAAAGIPAAAVVTSLGIKLGGDAGYQMLTLDMGGFLEQAIGQAAIARSESVEIQSLVVRANPEIAAPAPTPEPTPPAQTWGESTPPAPEPAPPAPEPTPKASEPDAELDSEGKPWDAEYHSAGKTKLADGTWRKKRGAPAEPAPAKVETTPPPAGDDNLSDILSQWA